MERPVSCRNEDKVIIIRTQIISSHADCQNGESRLACGIFNHDVSFTIFNNMYPRLLVSELQFDMPCSVHVFDAQNPQECSEFILAESRPNLPSPASLIEMYCNDEWHDSEAIIVPELTVLHHFVIVLGMFAVQRPVMVEP